MGAVTGTAVGDGRRVGRQLYRRDGGIALTDGGLNFQRLGIVRIVLGRQTAESLADFHARPLTQTQLVGVCVIDITCQAAADIIEEDVAAPLDGGHDVNVAAVAVTGTLGVIILEVVVHAVAVDRGILVDEAGIKAGDGDRRLVGRAGRIQAQQGAVIERQVRVRAVLAVICRVKFLVEGRVVGGSENTSVLGAEDDHRTGVDVGIVSPIDDVDILRQCFIDGFLEGRVHRQLDGMARLRHRRHGRADDDAIRVPGDGLDTVLAAQFILEGGFQTRHAEDVVHVVAFFLQWIGHLTVFVGHLPAFGSDLTHPAQNMGQDVAALITTGRSLDDFNTRQRKTVLLDGRNGLIADIFSHNEVVDIRERL